MVTTVQLVPEENLGVVVLTNQEKVEPSHPYSGTFLTTISRIPETDWITAYHEARVAEIKSANDAEKKAAAARVADSILHSNSRAMRPNTAIRGTARSSIKLENGKLVMYMMHTPSMIADLQHWQYDTFKAVFRNATVPDAFVTFVLNAEGKVDSVKWLRFRNSPTLASTIRICI